MQLKFMLALHRKGVKDGLRLQALVCPLDPLPRGDTHHMSTLRIQKGAG
ncbi:hypothetical protein Krac_6703 [Ktedonobacter racemifer DSM 44963]|uniref:Uncharacterized protein n=1 Tax=Ktedonobacter racemifer DSM 44963 TaxID=485913 RepID=D6TNU5_KTERA|nr:hypothetical protein Krac_6703 [Ktedonobacter racemifer DSM 44963]